MKLSGWAFRAAVCVALVNAAKKPVANPAVRVLAPGTAYVTVTDTVTIHDTVTDHVCEPTSANPFSSASADFSLPSDSAGAPNPSDSGPVSPPTAGPVSIGGPTPPPSGGPSPVATAAPGTGESLSVAAPAVSSALASSNCPSTPPCFLLSVLGEGLPTTYLYDAQLGNDDLLNFTSDVSKAVVFSLGNVNGTGANNQPLFTVVNSDGVTVVMYAEQDQFYPGNEPVYFATKDVYGDKVYLPIAAAIDPSDCTLGLSLPYNGANRLEDCSDLGTPNLFLFTEANDPQCPQVVLKPVPAVCPQFPSGASSTALAGVPPSAGNSAAAISTGGAAPPGITAHSAASGSPTSVVTSPNPTGLSCGAVPTLFNVIVEQDGLPTRYLGEQYVPGNSDSYEELPIIPSASSAAVFSIDSDHNLLSNATINGVPTLVYGAVQNGAVGNTLIQMYPFIHITSNMETYYATIDGTCALTLEIFNSNMVILYNCGGLLTLLSARWARNRGSSCTPVKLYVIPYSTTQPSIGATPSNTQGGDSLAPSVVSRAVPSPSTTAPPYCVLPPYFIIDVQVAGAESEYLYDPNPVGDDPLAFTPIKSQSLVFSLSSKGQLEFEINDIRGHPVLLLSNQDQQNAGNEPVYFSTNAVYIQEGLQPVTAVLERDCSLTLVLHYSNANILMICDGTLWLFNDAPTDQNCKPVELVVQPYTPPASMTSMSRGSVTISMPTGTSTSEAFFATTSQSFLVSGSLVSSPTTLTGPGTSSSEFSIAPSPSTIQITGNANPTLSITERALPSDSTSSSSLAAGASVIASAQTNVPAGSIGSMVESAFNTNTQSSLGLTAAIPTDTAGRNLPTGSTGSTLTGDILNSPTGSANQPVFGTETSLVSASGSQVSTNLVSATLTSAPQNLPSGSTSNLPTVSVSFSAQESLPSISLSSPGTLSSFSVQASLLSFSGAVTTSAVISALPFSFPSAISEQSVQTSGSAKSAASNTISISSSQSGVSSGSAVLQGASAITYSLPSSIGSLGGVASSSWTILTGVSGQQSISPSASAKPGGISTSGADISARSVAQGSATGSSTPSSASCAPVPPPTYAPQSTTQDCCQWYIIQSGDNCNTVETQFSLTAAQFYALNPGLDAGCTNLLLGVAYCVKGTPAPSGSVAGSQTSPAVGASTSGVPNVAVASTSAAPAAHGSSTLQGAVGGSTGISPSASAPVSSGGVAVSPTVSQASSSSSCAPVQAPTMTAPGSTANCCEYTVITSGTDCSTVESRYGITLDFFRALNPSLDADCYYLLAGYAYCVRGTPVSGTASSGWVTKTSLTVAASTTSSAQVCLATSSICDGGFEASSSSIAPWTGSGQATFTVVSSNQHSGNNALLITPQNNAVNSWSVTQSLTILPNTPYTLTFWARAYSGSSGAHAPLQICFNNDCQQVADIQVGDVTYVQFSRVFNGISSSSVDVSISTTGAGTAESVLLDDIALTLGISGSSSSIASAATTVAFTVSQASSSASAYPTIIVSDAGYTYRGGYKDRAYTAGHQTPDPSLDVANVRPAPVDLTTQGIPNNTVDGCLTSCRQYGANGAVAIIHGQYCYCGSSNLMTTNSTSSPADMTVCPGDKTQSCGGVADANTWEWAVYDNPALSSISATPAGTQATGAYSGAVSTPALSGTLSVMVSGSSRLSQAGASSTSGASSISGSQQSASSSISRGTQLGSSVGAIPSPSSLSQAGASSMNQAGSSSISLTLSSSESVQGGFTMGSSPAGASITSGGSGLSTSSVAIASSAGTLSTNQVGAGGPTAGSTPTSTAQLGSSSFTNSGTVTSSAPVTNLTLVQASLSNTAISSLSSTRPAPSSTVHVSTSSTRPGSTFTSTPLNVNGYIFQGNYEDNAYVLGSAGANSATDLLNSQNFTFAGTNTVELCVSTCASIGTNLYFAIVHKEVCACGTANLMNQNNIGTADAPCPGNSLEICGGPATAGTPYYLWGVYQFLPYGTTVSNSATATTNSNAYGIAVTTSQTSSQPTSVRGPSSISTGQVASSSTVQSSSTQGLAVNAGSSTASHASPLLSSSSVASVSSSLLVSSSGSASQTATVSTQSPSQSGPVQVPSTLSSSSSRISNIFASTSGPISSAPLSSGSSVVSSSISTGNVQPSSSALSSSSSGSSSNPVSSSLSSYIASSNLLSSSWSVRPSSASTIASNSALLSSSSSPTSSSVFPSSTAASSKTATASTTSFVTSARSSSIAVLVSTPSASSTALPILVFYRMGCYAIADPPPTLIGKYQGVILENSSDLTQEYCSDYCYGRYFGIVNGRSCYCGEDISSHSYTIYEANCTSLCSGDNFTYACGGPNGMSMWSYVTHYAPKKIGNYTSIGCVRDYSDGVTPLLGGKKYIDYYNMTQENCMAFCAGYTYWGVEWGRECYCGNSYSMSTITYIDTACWNVCTGNNSQLCGTDGRLNMYTTFKAAIQSPLGAYTALGCFTDPDLSFSTKYTYYSSIMTPTFCLNFCSGYLYWGLEMARYCWCTNTLNNKTTEVDIGECRYLCPGNRNYTCGAYQVVLVYRLTSFNKTSSTQTRTATASISSRSVSTSASAVAGGGSGGSNPLDMIVSMVTGG